MQIVAQGQVAGTWKTIVENGERMIEMKTVRRLTSVESRALAETAARYGKFLGTPISLSGGAGGGGRAMRGRLPTS